MTISAPTALGVENVACSAALRNYSANLQALAESQPGVIGRIERPEAELTWVLGRDGSLTAQDDAGRWLGDCSLPGRAAAATLKDLDLKGTTVCLLAPQHGAQVRRALDLLGPAQGLIVLSTDSAFLAVALHCADFSSELAGGRLFFIAGDGWRKDLEGVLEEYPGLPTPSVFLRPPGTPEELGQELITGAQEIFKQVNGRRAAALSAAGKRPACPQRPARRACVVAPGIYRLFADAGSVLAETAARKLEVRAVDPDVPTRAGQLALANVAAECDALLTADFARCDAPEALPREIPWLTWVTRPFVPSAKGARERDGILLADAAWKGLAEAAGWKAAQVAVAGWPVAEQPDPPEKPVLAVIADTRPLRTDIDEETFEYSSHMVLWEAIQAALAEDSLTGFERPEKLLEEWMRRLSISPDGLDRAMFLEQLIGPATTQGIVRLLVGGGVPVRLHGQGWGEVMEFREWAAGPVRSRKELLAAAAGATAVLRCAAGKGAHPVEGLGRPVIRIDGTSKTLAAKTKEAMAKTRKPSAAAGALLSADTIARMLST